MKNKLWKNWFLLLLGLWVMVMPWTGFPQEIDTVLSVVSGFMIVLFAFTMARPMCEHRSDVGSGTGIASGDETLEYDGDEPYQS